MAKPYVSIAVIRRLPRYYRYLEDLLASGVYRISSQTLSEKMGLTASQIRQDLNCFGGFGQQGYGYNVVNLKNEIAAILGVKRQYKTVILGVGNIGRALILNFDFMRRGFSIIGAFDIKDEIVGGEILGIHIYHADMLEQFCKKNGVEAAVLAVPGQAVLEMAQRLIKVGIRGIWNFTSRDLHLLSPGLIVENVHFSDSLMTLCYKLSDEDEKH